MIIILFLLLLLSPSPAHAIQYFVGVTSCNDGNAGTNSAAPWCTLQHAADTMQPGDTVTAANGNYAGFHTTISGTSGARIRFQAANKWGAIITSNTPGFNYGIRGEAAFIDIDGFGITLPPASQTGAFISGDFNNFTNNKIYDMAMNDSVSGVGLCVLPDWINNGGSGMSFSGNSGFISGNTFNRIGYALCDNAAGSGTVAIYVQGNDGLVTNNTIDNVGKPTRGGSGMFNYHGANVPLRNEIAFNTIGAASPANLIVRGIWVLAGDAKVHHNIIANAQTGLQVDDFATPATVEWNNTLYNNGIGLLINTGGGTYRNNLISTSTDYIQNNAAGNTLSNNLCTAADTGCTTVGNPAFVDAANGNFNLLPGSAAIDIGTTQIRGVTPGVCPSSNTSGVDIVITTGFTKCPDAGALESGGAPGTPTVAITSPTLIATFTTTTSTVVLGGTSTNTTSITWSNDQGGAGSSSTCCANWTTPAIVLQANAVNTITITATGAGGSAMATLKVAYSLPALVGSWAFDENGGTTALDRSGFANNGTFGAGATYVTNLANTYGISALSFNGGTVTVPDSASLKLIGGFTISARVYPFAAHTDFRAVLRKTTGYFLLSSSSSAFFCPASSVLAGFEDTTGGQPFICAPAPLSINTYSCVAATYDGVNLKLYVNKSLVQTQAATGLIAVSTGALTMGNDTNNEPLDGALDNVRLYNYDVGPTQINTDCDTGIVPAGVANFRISGATGLKLKGATAAEIGH